MAKRGLTATEIANLKPRDRRYEVPDPGCQGLWVAVQPSGRKGFAFRYRRPDTKKPAKLTIGSWHELPKGKHPKPVMAGGVVSLAGARMLAATALHDLKNGIDPGAQKLESRREDSAAKANTLRVVAEKFLMFEGPKLRTLPQRRSVFERLIFPELGANPIADIKRRDVVALLDEVQAENGPRMADECLSSLSRLFTWHAARDDDFRSPLVRGMRRAKSAHERARTRILDDDELRAVWTAAQQMGGTSGAYIKFLLLTAARKSEAANMRWSELKGLDWILPAARNKVKADLVRPLSAAARAALADVPLIEGSDFVFRPLRAFMKLKRELDERSGVTGWVLHDLRRTARSLMSRAGVNADHAERCLGHKIGGVRGVYDRYAFADEKGRAFEALAGLIERIVSPQPNIVALPVVQ